MAGSYVRVVFLGRSTEMAAEPTFGTPLPFFRAPFPGKILEFFPKWQLAVSFFLKGLEV